MRNIEDTGKEILLSVLERRDAHHSSSSSPPPWFDLFGAKTIRSPRTVFTAGGTRARAVVVIGPRRQQARRQPRQRWCGGQVREFATDADQWTAMCSVHKRTCARTTYNVCVYVRYLLLLWSIGVGGGYWDWGRRQGPRRRQQYTIIITIPVVVVVVVPNINNHFSLRSVFCAVKNNIGIIIPTIILQYA